jgi:hypothetical protein
MDGSGLMWRHCKICKVVVMEGGTGRGRTMRERIGCSEGVVQSRKCVKRKDHQSIRILCSSPNAHRIRAHPKNTRSRSGVHMMAAEGAKMLGEVGRRSVGRTEVIKMK